MLAGREGKCLASCREAATNIIIAVTTSAFLQVLPQREITGVTRFTFALIGSRIEVTVLLTPLFGLVWFGFYNSDTERSGELLLPL